MSEERNEWRPNVAPTPAISSGGGRSTGTEPITGTPMTVGRSRDQPKDGQWPWRVSLRLSSPAWYVGDTAGCASRSSVSRPAAAGTQRLCHRHSSAAAGIPGTRRRGTIAGARTPPDPVPTTPGMPDSSCRMNADAATPTHSPSIADCRSHRGKSHDPQETNSGTGFSDSSRRTHPTSCATPPPDCR